MRDQPAALDERNAKFWDELCGSALARSLGITDASAESLARFDAAYMDIYPYLPRYLDHALDGAEVLEIGLGYGTLSAQLMARGASYHGLDIAEGPVEMVRSRWRLAGRGDAESRIVQGSALELPFEDARFDYVFTIGCLHHTGDLPLAVQEVERVLKPGGTAVVMLYNLHSYRQLVKVRIPELRNRGRSRDQVAALYDFNATGDAAPHTDYVSAAQVRRLFAGFRSVSIDRRNFDNLRFIRRERLLGTLDRLLGLDLYVTARR
jgi:ubiquinone/menaquinone biosynthesis C-methylase UbiE